MPTKPPARSTPMWNRMLNLSTARARQAQSFLHEQEVGQEAPETAWSYNMRYSETGTSAPAPPRFGPGTRATAFGFGGDRQMLMHAASEAAQAVGFRTMRMEQDPEQERMNMRLFQSAKDAARYDVAGTLEPLRETLFFSCVSDDASLGEGIIVNGDGTLACKAVRNYAKLANAIGGGGGRARVSACVIEHGEDEEAGAVQADGCWGPLRVRRRSGVAAGCLVDNSWALSTVIELCDPDATQWVPPPGAPATKKKNKKQKPGEPREDLLDDPTVVARALISYRDGSCVHACTTLLCNVLCVCAYSVRACQRRA